MTWVRKQCDVCIRISGDMTLKDCTYCTKCNAWICKDHVNDLPARVLAALHKSQREIVNYLTKGVR